MLREGRLGNRRSVDDHTKNFRSDFFLSTIQFNWLPDRTLLHSLSASFPGQSDLRSRVSSLDTIWAASSLGRCWPDDRRRAADISQSVYRLCSALHSSLTLHVRVLHYDDPASALCLSWLIARSPVDQGALPPSIFRPSVPPRSLFSL